MAVPWQFTHVSFSKKELGGKLEGKLEGAFWLTESHPWSGSTMAPTLYRDGEDRRSRIGVPHSSTPLEELELEVPPPPLYLRGWNWSWKFHKVPPPLEELELELFHFWRNFPIPAHFAWAGGNMAERADHLGSKGGNNKI